MPPPFEANWETLDLADVKEFLDHELEEGLTWEAKGSRDLRQEQIRKAVSGFANTAIGGSVIIGAERDSAGVWQLPGAEFAGGEARTWLSSVLGKLSPAPRYDERVFSVGDDRLVAVVAVEPIDVPPCISDGSVFVRVSGQTVPIRDPAVLRSLHEQGRAARERALDRANEAAGAIYMRPLSVLILPWVTAAEAQGPRVRPAFALAVAPVSWSAAAAQAVMRASYAEKLHELLEARDVGGLRPPRAEIEPSRGCVQAVQAARGWTWVVRAYSSGAAAVAFSHERLMDPEAPIRVGDVMSDLGQAWRLAVGALEGVNAAGEAFLALRVQSPLYPPPNGARISPPPMVNVARAVTIEAPTDAELESIRRELEREAGQMTWEPEPDS